MTDQETSTPAPAPVIPMNRKQLREHILGQHDLKRDKVFIPEWGREVWFRELAADEKQRFEGELFKVRQEMEVGGRRRGRRRGAQKATVNIDVYAHKVRVLLVMMTAIDPETGERLFADTDRNALGMKNASAIQKGYDCSAKLSGLHQTEEPDEALLEALEKLRHEPDAYGPDGSILLERLAPIVGRPVSEQERDEALEWAREEDEDEGEGAGDERS